MELSAFCRGISKDFGLCENYSQRRPSGPPAVWSTHSASVHLSWHHLPPSAAQLPVILPPPAAPAPKQDSAKHPMSSDHVCLYEQSLCYGCACTKPALQAVHRFSMARCTCTKLPLGALSPARPHLSVPRLDVAATPSAECAKTQSTCYPELSDRGLLCAQWRTASG